MADLAASFNRALTETLARKTLLAAHNLGCSRVALAGGVAANATLRALLEQGCRENGMQFFAPPLEHDPEEDGYYDHELEGLAVIHEGTRVGEVTDITHGPAATLLTVTMDEDERDVLIPLVDAIVPEINLGEKTATITPPDGLLDL